MFAESNLTEKTTKWFNNRNAQQQDPGFPRHSGLSSTDLPVLMSFEVIPWRQDAEL